MISIGVTGMDELGRQLEALGRDVSTKILRDAGRAALEPVLEDMQQHAGYDDTASGPHMRDSISIRSTTRGRSQVTLRVGPSKLHHMKALAQEFGTVKQVAAPFIRPALDYHKTQVLRILAAELRYGIENR
ncbi:MULTISPECIES: HK97-gp10 family putative phage morphogenesis protein [Serratia]|uniref:HK97-gp10 family putative phage morphogenesis protein n=1 Tax=Serratia TaxID=613 RepID=UPI001A1D7AE1|nr:HK97-gp10 family putative phage morphogenesis protein [Serratia marcescens]MDP8624920.1 HK97 gp10 family phage protein [Serratia marcescens]MDP8674351.1 HK97 gp10 family phage protein [Serratia marcescens]MDP8689353.1 HK97 gp10 family phage protein [Serratia marcescens]MDP8699100.1 HK97 gp10 family phage protein [Serratia marcescens]MDP8708778.1 HK97 gp10 family phage protein [Serratia marcescens]